MFLQAKNLVSNIATTTKLNIQLDKLEPHLKKCWN